MSASQSLPRPLLSDRTSLKERFLAPRGLPDTGSAVGILVRGNCLQVLLLCCQTFVKLGTAYLEYGLQICDPSLVSTKSENACPV